MKCYSWYVLSMNKSLLIDSVSSYSTVSSKFIMTSKDSATDRDIKKNPTIRACRRPVYNEEKVLGRVFKR
jgi:hypothetical protein